MSRTLPRFLTTRPTLRPTPGRLVLAAAVALGLVVALATLLPGRDPGSPSRDGAITPVTGEYAATTGAPGPGEVDAAARAEIDRVLAEAPAGAAARAPRSAAEDAEVLAEQVVRCADFEGQQYCLGRGWTETPEAELQDRVAAAAEAPAGAAARTAGAGPETTGDLSDADLLAQRAAMGPTERERVERAELEAAARSVAKVVLLRHQLLGEPLPEGFLERHPEARATASTSAAAPPARSAARPTARARTIKDYPRRSTVLTGKRTRQQVRTYWCGPATMQMIAWGWSGEPRSQRHWARRLGTTTSGSAISEMVRVVNGATGFDRESRAGRYVVLDIGDWGYKKWLLLQMRHIEDYRAPVVLHPILLKRFYPYLDDDASGHFQVGRGYDKNGRKPADLGYFEPWNQQRFDPSEPFIERVQWRRAYKSFRANKAHPHQNIGV